VLQIVLGHFVRSVSLLGSTGTIGVNTLDVIARHPQSFRVFALSAHSNVERLVQQCEQFRPRFAVLCDAQKIEACHSLFRAKGLDTKLLFGDDGLRKIAADPNVDTVMAAIVGAAGLKPTLAAARAGKRVLLANKEALVMSGNLLMDAVHEHHAELLPIDSEHNAVFQTLPVDRKKGLVNGGVKKIILTASGGPFRTVDPADLEHVTPAQAIKHPNWIMGRKISVDSATMMNKGLEMIEACWLFDATPSQVEILIHPESIVHSMVSYADGSVLAQMSNPDMRTPIAYGLGYPARIDAGVPDLDLAKIGRLNFEALNPDQFPCVQLAYDAMSRGGTATAILNAANEVAVDAFLRETLSFRAIASAIEFAMREIEPLPVRELDDVLRADEATRAVVGDWIAARGRAQVQVPIGVEK
jgi:1-deoxy-D-xylulose-5-phosphate reductoisomerase